MSKIGITIKERTGITETSSKLKKTCVHQNASLKINSQEKSRETLIKDISKRLVSGIYKEVLHVNNNIQVLKMVKD